MKGIEPPTPSLPWKCSTPELHRQSNREISNFLFIVFFVIVERETRLELATLSLEG